MDKKPWHEFALERIGRCAERLSTLADDSPLSDSQSAMIQALLKLFEEAEMTEGVQREVESGLMALKVECPRVFRHDHLGHYLDQAIRYMKR